ncbi:MAG: hypothetical protein KDA44_05360 [Planctomycetales bacterium]|nr:hypothetical protein [Planctomycetales bacterium]
MRHFSIVTAALLACMLAWTNTAYSDDGLVYATDAEPLRDAADWNDAGQPTADDAPIVLTQATRQGGRSDTVRAGNRTASRTARSSRMPYMIGDQFGGGSGSFDLLTQGSNGSGLSLASIESPIFGGNRYNVAEANSALPSDRLLFSYRHLSNVFNSVGLGQAGASDVDQFVIGYEKSFLDGMGSMQFQVPMYRELSSQLDVYDDAFGSNLAPTDRHGEFGNLQAALKLALIERGGLTITGGAGVTSITADDAQFSGSFDANLPLLNSPSVGTTAPTSFTFDGEVKNCTVHVIPYLAWAYRPQNAFFHQGFLQVDVPVNSTPFSVEATGVITPDSLYDAETFDVSGRGNILPPTLLRANLSFGAWVVQNPCNDLVQGVAALFEVHYTHALNDPNGYTMPLAAFTDPSMTEDPFTVDLRAGGPAGNVDVVNLSAGVVLDLGSCMLTNGIVVPISGNGVGNRAFDFEYNMQLNRLF